MKKKTLKKNSSNRKPISYSTEFRLDITLNNFVGKLCPAMINVFLLFLSFFVILSFFVREGEGWGAEGRGVKMFHTYRQTYRQTYRASDEAGPRGAFAPKNYCSKNDTFTFFFIKLKMNIKHNFKT